ncbi:MAG TPA: glycosyltransferase family 4 protein [Patescibacteria group bacterium]|jgi:glycogen(starch) synthase|nr:glycosyltransferase family 4 protein [Patescibacteria group bacterium]
MNILMLGWELPPHNSGGLGVACYQLCKHLAFRGVSIDFVLPYSANHDIDFMKLVPALSITAEEFINLAGAYNTNCDACKSSSCEHAYPTDLRGRQQRYKAFVEQYVQTTQPDVIHMHDWLTYEAGMRAKQLTNKPLVAHVHATEFDRSGEHSGNPLVHDIEYNGLLMADRIIAVSQLTKDIIVKGYDIPPSKIEVIHNSIDKDEVDKTATESTYVYLSEMKKLGYKVVVSLGRLTVQKGVTYLLQAARQALDIDDKIIFLIVGAGELRDELLEQAANLGIAQNVIFTGFLRGKRWRDAYAIGDMFVMSSVSEPFGITALEAAGYGNTLVLSKQSGVCEVLRSALKFNYWDTKKLADYIVNIAKNNALRDQLVSDAEHEFNKLSWHDAADQCQRLYASYASAAGIAA